MAREGLELNDLSACFKYGTSSRCRKAMRTDDEFLVELDIADDANTFALPQNQTNANQSILRH